jgi:hypothetical protein
VVGDELRAVNAERVAPDRHDVRDRAACGHAAIKGYDRNPLTDPMGIDRITEAKGLAGDTNPFLYE